LRLSRKSAAPHKTERLITQPPQTRDMKFPVISLVLAAALALAAESPKSFAVTVSGKPNGPAMILIPGLSSSGAVWDATVKHFGSRYECHVLTLAGFAGQPRVSDGPFLSRVKDDLIAYIEAKKLTRPILAGHSLGGHMALWIASGRPTLVGDLLIVDSLPNLGAMMFPDASKLKEQAAGMREMITKQTKEQYGAFLKNGPMLKSMVGDAGYAQVFDWSLTSDPVAIGNAMYDLYTTDLREAVSKIASRALVLGSWVGYAPYSDRPRTLAIFEEQYAKMPRKQIVLSDTAKHFIMLDEPAWFLDQADAFLKANAK
jgi:N-formylmaleamate deformylase